MIEFSVETEIARAPAEVFAYVADPAKLPTWQRNTVSVTQEGDGPVGVGTRLHEVHRAGGRELESVVEVREFEPGRVFALKLIDGPLPLDVRLTFSPAGRGTRFTFTGSGEVEGALRLAGPFLAQTLKRQFERHCEQLKRVLESQPPP
jgi:uncharacterized protein YndB with AHSA1/START domain